MQKRDLSDKVTTISKYNSLVGQILGRNLSNNDAPIQQSGDIIVTDTTKIIKKIEEAFNTTINQIGNPPSSSTGEKAPPDQAL